MNPALAAEIVIREVPGSVPCQTLVPSGHTEQVSRNLLQQRATPDAKRAIAANRVAEVGIDLELDRAAMTRSAVGAHRSASFQDLKRKAVVAVIGNREFLFRPDCPLVWIQLGKIGIAVDVGAYPRQVDAFRHWQE